jgi:hypothetical protein
MSTEEWHGHVLRILSGLIDFPQCLPITFLYIMKGLMHTGSLQTILYTLFI